MVLGGNPLYLQKESMQYDNMQAQIRSNDLPTNLLKNHSCMILPDKPIRRVEGVAKVEHEEVSIMHVRQEACYNVYIITICPRCTKGRR